MQANYDDDKILRIEHFSGNNVEFKTQGANLRMGNRKVIWLYTQKHVTIER